MDSIKPKDSTDQSIQTPMKDCLSGQANSSADVDMYKADRANKTFSFSSIFGTGRGLFNSTAEVDHYIREGRAERS